jgi:hypothetical protein
VDCAESALADLNSSSLFLGGAFFAITNWDSHSKEAVTVTVSEQRGSEPISKKSESTEKKPGAGKESSVAVASNEDISRLQFEVQELLSWAERFLLSQTGISQQGGSDGDC